MKKTILLVFLSLLLCLALVGCGSENATETPQQSSEAQAEAQTSSQTPSSSQAPAASESPVETPASTDVPAEDPAESQEPATLQGPVMEWWDLYNPNGFDTLTAVISNPNDITVDFSYDLVFYKEGAEAGRIEYCLSNSVMPGQKAVIWANTDVPAATDADDVRLENIDVMETYYPAIGGKVEFVSAAEGEATYSYEFDSDPYLASIWFVHYNDSNGNGQCDKGEIVVTDLQSALDQKGTLTIETDVYSFTDTEVYFIATEN